MIFLEFILRHEDLNLIIGDVLMRYGVLAGNTHKYSDTIAQLQTMTKSSKAIAMWISNNRSDLNDNDSVQVDTELAQRGFKIEYKDKNQALKHYVDFVRQNIIGLYNTNVSDGSYYYALYFAVVQSSGYGKSRMLLEAGKKDLNTVYGCVRTNDSANGFPASNSNLHVFLQSNNSVDNLRKFLVICYFVAFDHLQKNQTSKSTLLPLNDFVLPNPSKIFERFWNLVIQKYDNPPMPYDDLFKWFTRTQLDFIELKKNNQPYKGMLNGQVPSELLIVFDEAKSLLERNSNVLEDDGDFSVFRNLRRALRSIGSRNMILVFTDTLSSISNFTPASSFDSSYRPGKNFYLLPPYYELLTYDSIRTFLESIGRDANSFESVLHYAAVFSQGRPLWKALYLITNISEIELEQLVFFARRKLANSQSLDLTGEVVKIAMIAVRCGIKGVLDHHLGSALMSSYMGTGIFIDDDRIRMVVEYPVEPVLGEAACQNLHSEVPNAMQSEFKFSFNPERMQSFLLAFISKCISGLVSAGEIGEIIARCILSFSYDSVVINRIGERKGYLPPPLLFSRPIAVKDFLLALVSPEYTTYFKSHFGFDVPVLASEFIDSFGKGLICFTSWLNLEDLKQDMSAEEWQPLLKKWFLSRVAIIMPLNQKGIDLLIPVKLGDMFSFILIQVKNRVNIMQAERMDVAGEKLTPISSFKKDFYPGLEQLFVGMKRKRFSYRSKINPDGDNMEEDDTADFDDDDCNGDDEDVTYSPGTDNSASSDSSRSSTDKDDTSFQETSAQKPADIPSADPENPTLNPVAQTVKDVPLSALFPQYLSIYMEVGPETLVNSMGSISQDSMKSYAHTYPNHLLLLGFESTTISTYPELSAVFKLFCRRHVENVDLYDRLTELKATNPDKYQFSKAPGCNCRKGCDTRRCGCRKQGKPCSESCYCSLNNSKCGASKSSQQKTNTAIVTNNTEGQQDTADENTAGQQDTADGNTAGKQDTANGNTESQQDNANGNAEGQQDTLTVGATETFK